MPGVEPARAAELVFLVPGLLRDHGHCCRAGWWGGSRVERLEDFIWRTLLVWGDITPLSTPLKRANVWGLNVWLAWAVHGFLGLLQCLLPTFAQMSNHHSHTGDHVVYQNSQSAKILGQVRPGAEVRPAIRGTFIARPQVITNHGQETSPKDGRFLGVPVTMVNQVMVVWEYTSDPNPD